MSHNTLIKTIVVVCIFLALHVTAATSSQAMGVRVDKIMVEVTEGISLATETYLPQEDGRYPTVLIRTTYGDNMAWMAEYLATQGYAVVLQHVRGMNGSQGDFFPFAYEKADGMATLTWALKQPFCNGDVGLWGISYLGFSAYEIASTGHPAIKAVFVLSGWSAVEPFIAPGGSFHLMAHLPWFMIFLGGENPPPDAWPHIYRTTPISGFFQGAGSAMEQILAAPYDYTRFKMPIMHVTGWYDYVYPETLRTYETVVKQVPDAAEQRLIVGVWPHNYALNGQSNAGEEDFGQGAAWGAKKVKEITTRWFGLHLKGQDDGLGSEPLVKLFVMGRNEWRNFDAWPPRAMKTQTWYVGSADRANGSAGSGTLSATSVDGKESDRFVFNPEAPVPTTGGANWHMARGNRGVLDQSELEKRLDVLVYTSEPLASDVTLIGPIKATVYAATEGKDTDFTAKLVEVRGNGYARNIVDGIIRARHLFGLGANNWLKPGKVYKYDIDMGATAIVIPSGSRIRLEISSSNFPKYTRNPNTGVDAIHATEFMSVTQTIYHTKEHPTQVLLPVLQESARSIAGDATTERTR